MTRFVEMLESHHSLVVKALQKLYKYCVNNEGFPGEPLAETADGHPLTHAILDRLGLIRQAEENADEPEEDADNPQYAALLSVSDSRDGSATTELSPESRSPSAPPQRTGNVASSSPAPAHDSNYNDNGRSGYTSEWDSQSIIQPDRCVGYAGFRYDNSPPFARPLFTGAMTISASDAIYPEFSSVPVSSQEQPSQYYLHSNSPGARFQSPFHGVTAGPSSDMYEMGDHQASRMQEQQLYSLYPNTGQILGYLGSHWND